MVSLHQRVVYERCEDMQTEYIEKQEAIPVVEITSSAGYHFKQGTKLTANLYLEGIEVDPEGTDYLYEWTREGTEDDETTGTFFANGKHLTLWVNPFFRKGSFNVSVRRITQKKEDLFQPPRFPMI